MRPPQPEVAPSGDSDCQTDCWSLCENSLGGSLTDLFLYSSLVVGWTSEPTLSTTPSLPASNSGISGASAGASAYWWLKPPESTGAVVGVSAVAASCSRV